MLSAVEIRVTCKLCEEGHLVHALTTLTPGLGVQLVTDHHGVQSNPLTHAVVHLTSGRLIACTTMGIEHAMLIADHLGMLPVDYRQEARAIEQNASLADILFVIQQLQGWVPT